MKKGTLLTFVTFVLIAMNINAQTWTVLNSGIIDDLQAIFSTTTNDVYAGGSNGVRLKSVNQGASWSSQVMGYTNVNAMFFTSPTTGYWDGGEPTSNLSYVYKTTNSGGSWTLQHSFSPGAFRGLCFPNATKGYAVGGYTGTDVFIYKTIDSGNTWSSQTSPIGSGVLFSVSFADTSVGYAVGINGTIIKTTNGGATWNNQTSGTGNILFSVYFVNANIGYAVGDIGTILKTTNGGSSWNSISIPGFTTTLYGVYFLDANRGTAVGENGAILETLDGGTTWNQVLGITSQRLRSVHFFNQNLGYACGKNGTIIKYTNTIGINELENIAECNAYPNPANDQLTLNFNGKNINNITIAIFNELGQSIFEFQENIQNDHFTKTIDTRTLAAGIYYISVTSEKSKWTKKISISH